MLTISIHMNWWEKWQDKHITTWNKKCRSAIARDTHVHVSRCILFLRSLRVSSRRKRSLLVSIWVFWFLFSPYYYSFLYFYVRTMCLNSSGWTFSSPWCYVSFSNITETLERRIQLSLWTMSIEQCVGDEVKKKRDR